MIAGLPEELLDALTDAWTAGDRERVERIMVDVAHFYSADWMTGEARDRAIAPNSATTLWVGSYVNRGRQSVNPQLLLQQWLMNFDAIALRPVIIWWSRMIVSTWWLNGRSKPIARRLKTSGSIVSPETCS